MYRGFANCSGGKETDGKKRQHRQQQQENQYRIRTSSASSPSTIHLTVYLTLNSQIHGSNDLTAFILSGRSQDDLFYVLISAGHDLPLPTVFRSIRTAATHLYFIVFPGFIYLIPHSQAIHPYIKTPPGLLQAP
ncbi:MAG: hypothetical protein CSA26_07885 [Desulfobacterales bacterium]|nr:MAG: hypothetical protein CSA26_07885 [Desulfobacterales bacterium]